MSKKIRCHDGEEREVYTFKGEEYYPEDKKGGFWRHAHENGEILKVEDEKGVKHEVRYYRKQFVYLLKGIYYNAENHLATAMIAKPLPYTYLAHTVAQRAYKNEKRNTTGLPYMVHTMNVYTECQSYRYSNTDVMLATALLHDYLEDAVAKGADREATIIWMEEEFGHDITKLVLELTSDEKGSDGLYEITIGGETKRVKKVDYINYKLSIMSEFALFLKILDLTANLYDANTLHRLVNRIANNVRFLVTEREKEDTKIEANWTRYHERALIRIIFILEDQYDIIIERQLHKRFKF